MSNIPGLDSSRNKTVGKDKLVVKKGNVQYTPLTVNAILKDQTGVGYRQKNRIKTKSGDLSSMGLTNSSIKQRPVIMAGINSNAVSKFLE
jgi:hypothetical protein